MQWTSFVSSEIRYTFRRYIITKASIGFQSLFSKQQTNDTFTGLSRRNYWRQTILRVWENVKVYSSTHILIISLLAHDMIVGFPLLQLPAQVIERFPKTQRWLELVKTMSTPYSTQLQQHLQENLPKKEAKKPNNKKEKFAVEEKKRKLKVLCIHGYRQSAKSAKEKLGSFRYHTFILSISHVEIFLFRKLVGKYADLDFITAPHLIPSDNPDEQVNCCRIFLIFHSLMSGSVWLVVQPRIKVIWCSWRYRMWPWLPGECYTNWGYS